MSESTASILSASSPTRWRLFFWAFMLGTLLLHVFLAANTPISGDEAYYWDCARHLDWSSFDQPLLMIWSINPFRLFLGETALAIRFPAIIASFLLGIFLLGLLRRFGAGYREATKAYALVHTLPLFFLGSFYESTDIGMSAAYLAAAWAIVAIAQGEKRAWWGLGIALGFGFLAKFPVVLILPALIPVFFRRNIRRHLLGPTPWLAALLSAAITTPVWIWAIQHNWDNLRFQLEGRHKTDAWGLKHLLEFIGANLLLATPFIAIAILMALFIFLRKKQTERYCLLIGALMPLLFFGFISLKEGVGGHWGGPGLLLGCVILILTPFRGRKWLIGLGAVMGLGLSIAAVLIISFPEPLIDFQWSYAGKPRNINTRQLRRILGNEDLLRQMKNRRKPGEALFFTSYSETHLFALLSGGTLPTRLANLREGRHGLASLYWYTRDDMLGRDLTILSTKKRKTEAWLLANCTELEEEAPIEVQRNGEVIRHFDVYRCIGLKTDGGLFARGSAPLDIFPEIPQP